MKFSHFVRVIESLPRVVRRRRARGGLTHEQFKDVCLIFQICVLVHSFLLASVWWARRHRNDPMDWLGVAMAVGWVIFFWWFLFKQAYTRLENAVAHEIQR